MPVQSEVGISFAAWLPGRYAAVELHKCGLMPPLNFTGAVELHRCGLMPPLNFTGAV